MKRVSPAAVGAIAVMLILAGCGAPASSTSSAEATTASTVCSPQHPRTIRVALTATGLVYTTYYLAVGLDAFQKYGVTIEPNLIGAGPDIAALLNGEEDVSLTAFSRVFTLRDKGQNVIAIGSIAPQFTGQLVISSSAWKAAGLSDSSSWQQKVKALRGLTIGSSAVGAGIDNVLVGLLEAGGVSPSSGVHRVAFKDGGPMLAAFSQGRLDAMIWSAPVTTEAILNDGGHMLFNFAQGDYPPMKGFQHAVVVSANSWIQNKDNAATAGCFLRALYAAWMTARGNSSKASAIVREQLPAFAQLPTAVWNRAWADSYPFIKVASPCINPKRAQVAWKVDKMSAPIARPVNSYFNDSIATAYLPAGACNQ